MAKPSITTSSAYGGQIGIVKRHVASYHPISECPITKEARLEVQMVNGARFTILSTYSDFYNQMIEV